MRLARVLVEFDPPIVWEKRNPRWPDAFTLQMTVTGIKERNGPWYLTEHTIISVSGERRSLGRSEWADWSHSGDLLYSKGGSLFRHPVRTRGTGAGAAADRRLLRRHVHPARSATRDAALTEAVTIAVPRWWAERISLRPKARLP